MAVLPPMADLPAEESFSEVDFNWDMFEHMMIKCLIFSVTVDMLVDYWKSNANKLDWAKKVAPLHWQRIRDAFALKKAAIKGD